MFHESHFHVISYSDRHLFIHVTAPRLKIRVLVIHAPHEEAHDCSPEAWWNQVRAMIAQHSSELPLIILGDFNARFGNVVSDSMSKS